LQLNGKSPGGRRRKLDAWHNKGREMARALRQCEFRFYEELGDFLPPERRRRSFIHQFHGTPAVKDRIEALGVPHTEVDLILVDGLSVGFMHKLRGGEQVAVYPMLECFEHGSGSRLRPRPLREPRFVLDVHLGRLASYLRLLGFDCLYRNDYGDEELLSISRDQQRILLSRDTGLLKRAALTHGAFLHATDPRRQLREVCDRFQLDARIAPFTRCARCNGTVEPLRDGPGVPSTAFIPGRTLSQHRGGFSQCQNCGQLYWPGSHLARLRQRLAEVGVPI
jgi:uncharacterized protein with PIN domain